MIRRISIVALGLALTLAAPRAARAQATRADSAAVLLQAARQLEAQGQRAQADALLTFLMRTYADTPAATEAAQRLASHPAPPERGGRIQLLAWGTIYGAWLGVAVPAMFSANDATAYGIGLLLGGPAGLVSSNAYARAHHPTSGQAAAMTFGSQWGTWQGLGWQIALDLGVSKTTDCSSGPCFTYENTSEAAPFTAMVLGGLGGLAAGTIIGSRLRPTAGQSSYAAHAAVWGTWYGIVAAVLADAEGDPLLTTVLLGGNAGLLAGALAAPRDVSSGRVWLTSALGVAGVAAGFGIDLLVQPEDAGTVLLIPGLTSIAALAYGWHVTDGLDARRRPATQPGQPRDAALLRIEDGRVRLGAPGITPTVVKVAEGRLRPVYRPALALSLLRAEF